MVQAQCQSGHLHDPTTNDRHIEYFYRVLVQLFKQAFHEIETRKELITPDSYKNYWHYLITARHCLDRCKHAMDTNQWHKARGETVCAEIMLHHVLTALDLNIPVSDHSGVPPKPIPERRKYG